LRLKISHLCDDGLFRDAKDLIYEGIATFAKAIFNLPPQFLFDAKDLIYEGIATIIIVLIDRSLASF